jgi:hypothetical protein
MTWNANAVNTKKAELSLFLNDNNREYKNTFTNGLNTFCYKSPPTLRPQCFLLIECHFFSLLQTSLYYSSLCEIV